MDGWMDRLEDRHHAKHYEVLSNAITEWEPWLCSAPVCVCVFAVGCRTAQVPNQALLCAIIQQ